MLTHFCSLLLHLLKLQLRKCLWSTNNPDSQGKGLMPAKGSWAGRELTATGPAWEGDQVKDACGGYPRPCSLCCHCPMGPAGCPQYPKKILHLNRVLSCANKCCHMAQGGSGWATELHYSSKSKRTTKIQTVQQYFQGTARPCFLYFPKVSKDSEYNQIHSYGQ